MLGRGGSQIGSLLQERRNFFSHPFPFSSLSSLFPSPLSLPLALHLAGQTRKEEKRRKKKKGEGKDGGGDGHGLPLQVLIIFIPPCLLARQALTQACFLPMCLLFRIYIKIVFLY